ncbi:5'/3'-nucleotidase SurE [Desulfosporosinus orientis DSM 765]|uniref:5'-nucleotidase SurE n=1 Tax=Desulfosporosinus orientis (strain ATCC 19365 / DSM 765 / NCIMB 8382 / VKM B-1628 / Singapore I) TaxID=768706 RepID=G7WDS7_DESOD|nr:5'/3'-nucleotidase SurE [Desulfosporosinus orientis]AET68834.1 5'/3'-nucleotidase SurE [Desulfosporosinus orientis DSM 765]
MHILLTNDDGYQAAGIQTLYRTLRAKTTHKISIVAPDSQRSATGHSITLFHPLFFSEYQLDGEEKGYAVSGTPSDCVKLAVQGELVPKPDLVVSGINQGSNLGTDVFYSGTVSAAMEGVILGIPALAVSVASYEFVNFEPSAEYLAESLDHIVQGHQTGLLNINFPGNPRESWSGIKVTRLGRAVYDNVFERRVNPRGRVYYWQCGNLSKDLDEDTDLRAIQENYISITPMHSDLTDFKRIENYKKTFQKHTV